MIQPNFDDVAWREHCKQAVDNAQIGSGQSETLFAQKLYNEIYMRLLNLPLDHRAIAALIAREFGYLNAEDLEVDAQWNADHGYCSHGLPYKFCPVGCERDEAEIGIDCLNEYDGD